MPRGGRRPGAGAPKGNHNALKTGKYSKRLKEAMSNLISYRKKQIKNQQLADHVVKEAIRRYMLKANNYANPLNRYPSELDSIEFDG